MLFNQSKIKRVTVLLFAFMLIAPLLHAEPGKSGKRRGPPPEAIEACGNLSQGSNCTFVNRRGKDMQGSCLVRRSDQNALICAPEGRRRHGKADRKENT